MKVYVVRWLSRIDGEEECGNFEVCYTDEADARKAMLEDVANTKEDWGQDVKVSQRFLGPNGKGKKNCDYAEITVKDDDTYDYHEWWIDALDVA